MVADVTAVRNDTTTRESFLGALLAQNEPAILFEVQRFGERRFSFSTMIVDARQTFLISANEAIDVFRIEDDGRGKSRLDAFCAWKGILGVRSFLRDELGCPKRSRHKYEAQRQTQPVSSIAAASRFEDPKKRQAAIFRDPRDYARAIVNRLMLESFISQIRDPLDRRIVEMIALEGKAIPDIPEILGITQASIYVRLYRLKAAYAGERETLREAIL